VPAAIEGNSAKAIVTVTAKDKTGREATDSITFTILSNPKPEPSAVPEATPEPPVAEKGMSTGTKVALGAGALALAGGGVALVTLGGDDKGGEDDGIPSLSGTWVGTIFSDDSLGNPFPFNIELVLEQSGDQITGHGNLETVPIEFVTGTYTYPNVNLTLDSFGVPPAYVQGTVTDNDTITGRVDGSGFDNDQLTLKRR
jgi:hypothetical protein